MGVGGRERVDVHRYWAKPKPTNGRNVISHGVLESNSSKT